MEIGNWKIKDCPNCGIPYDMTGAGCRRTVGNRINPQGLDYDHAVSYTCHECGSKENELIKDRELWEKIRKLGRVMYAR